MKKLFSYLEENRIRFIKEEDGFICDLKKFLYVTPDDGVLFDEKFHLIPEEKNKEFDFYCFKFGGNYYYTSKGSEKDPKLTQLKYIGKANQQLPTRSFLGVRGGFELLNGSRLYKDWCKKAKFLGCHTLGICEKNTLAGTLKFQLECESAGIKPVLGMTVTILRQSSDLRYDVKCYAETEEGWNNLLSISKELNFVNYKFIKEETFLKLTAGLSIIIDPKSVNFEDIFPIDLIEGIMYQLDTVEYESNDRDKGYLLNLKKFIKSKIPPISITDAFYLDKEDFRAKEILNSISNVREYKSKNQYLKPKEDYFYELDSIFNPENKLFDSIYKQATDNEKDLVLRCKFKIETGNRHLPKYKMSVEESEKYEDNEDMFYSLLEEGLKNRIPKHKHKEYVSRLKTETNVIELGNVVDYFLITYDIMKYARDNNILTGLARGSAGGSLVSYLLGIIEINPLDFDLLFERFLNVGRVKKSLPDIDCDYPGEKRGQIKGYIEQRYGNTQVCSVGTYTALQLRAAIKDVAKIHNIDFGEVNIATSFLDVEDKTIEDLFNKACRIKKLKYFVNNYPHVINDIQLILRQPKAQSIHACAMMIFPEEKSMHLWTPIRIQDGMAVSEWEGNELDSAGFLKQDILGVKQLDKFEDTIKSIKLETSDEIDIYNLPLDDEQVYKYFRKGWNGDVFHFGSHGLTGYCRELKPENSDDLIAAISLYRPGAMENNFHNEYVLRKEGKREVEYFTGSEKILNKTYGVFVYQEQIMHLCQVLGGLTLVEADDVRKAMVKKKYEELTKYKSRFIDFYVKEFGVEQSYSEHVWESIDKASTYLFNKSHATAYAITGYISQWLKVHYPIHFWTTAFKSCKEENIPNYINEINLTGSIKIMPPDINKSFTSVYTDYSTNTIYWALSSVKQVGETSTDQIIEERNKNGEYFSLDEFLERHTFKGSKVNKRVIENLILSGAFDGIEDIRNPIDRQTLIQQFRKRNKVKADEDKDIFSSPNVGKEWWWVLQQKLLSGIAFLNYEDLCSNQFSRPYFDPITFAEDSSIKSKCVVGGYVIELNIRESKKGKFAKLVLENNYEIFSVLIWAEQFEKFEELISGCEKTLLIISGTIQFDKHNKCNVLQSDENTEMCCLK